MRPTTPVLAALAALCLAAFTAHADSPPPDTLEWPAAAAGVDVFVARGGVFAVASSPAADAVYVVNVTDPDAMRTVGVARDGERGFALAAPAGVATFEASGGRYALVADYSGDAIHIANITDPRRPEAVSTIPGGRGGLEALDGPWRVEVFAANGGVYAMVVSRANPSVLVLDVTDPVRPEAVSPPHGNVAGMDLVYPSDGAVFAAGSRTYALIADSGADAVHVIDLTDPARPAAVEGALRWSEATIGPRAVEAFEAGGRTYALVATSSAVSVSDVTDPAAASAVYEAPLGGGDPDAGAAAAAVYRDGDLQYAVLASRGGALHALNVTDPVGPAAHPVGLAGGHGGRVFGLAVYVSGGDVVALVADMDAGLKAVVLDPAGGQSRAAQPAAPPEAPVTRHPQEEAYMLGLINAERERFGLERVALGDNPAAQAHAQDMLARCYFSHWGMDGLKPYMRYALAGGYQTNAENISGLGYCILPGDGFFTLGVYNAMDDAVRGFMASPGHRDTLLDPHNAAVNLGLAWDDYNIIVVQHFEYAYAEFEEPPRFDDGVLSFSGSTRDGARLPYSDALGVQVYYDAPPHDLTRGQVSRTYCYDTGMLVAALRPPAPPGYYYPSSAMTGSYEPCRSPYDVPANLPGPASYEEAHRMSEEAVSWQRPDISRTAYWYDAGVWRTSEYAFDVRADVSHMLRQHGSGVYTITVWAVAGGEDVIIAEYPIFHDAGG